MTKLKSILLCLISVGVIGCNQSGEYTFTDGNQSQNVGSGQRDSRSGAIIKQELDEYGNLVDCGIGSSAKKLNLPSDKVKLFIKSAFKFFTLPLAI